MLKILKDIEGIYNWFTKGIKDNKKRTIIVIVAAIIIILVCVFKKDIGVKYNDIFFTKPLPTSQNCTQSNEGVNNGIMLCGPNNSAVQNIYNEPQTKFVYKVDYLNATSTNSLFESKFNLLFATSTQLSQSDKLPLPTISNKIQCATPKYEEGSGDGITDYAGSGVDELSGKHVYIFSIICFSKAHITDNGSLFTLLREDK